LSLDSGPDDQMGSADELGWYARFDGWLSPDDNIRDDLELTPEALDELASMAGAILYENDQGFVSADLYDTPEELEEAWAQIQSRYEEAYGPQEDDITTPDYQHFYQYGHLIFTVEDDEDMDIALREHMSGANFWPNVWAISDHGNAHLLSISQE
jgi:hypothetical protein